MIKEISAENYLGIEIQEHELFDHEHLFVFEDDDKNFKAFIAIPVSYTHLTLPTKVTV